MDDPLLVRGLQRFGDLPRDRQRLVERHRALRDPIRERRPLHELQDERAYAVGVFEAVNGRDVRMVERGEDFALRAETGPADPDRCAKASGSTLIATSRLSRVSRAR